jgi:hypothetical protein
LRLTAEAMQHSYFAPIWAMHQQPAQQQQLQVAAVRR